jgi:LysM repeat protein
MPPGAAADAGVPDRYKSPEAAVPDRYQAPDAGAGAAVPDAGATADRYQTPSATPTDRYGTPLPAAQANPTADPPAADRYGTPDAGAAPPAQGAPEGTFVELMDAAKRELEAGQLAGALAKLSTWYDATNLSPPEQQQLNQLLDQVAGTVVYSTQHLLEPPYEVQPGERLEDIGQRYSVPWQLLAKINGIDDPNALRPGERLKVVRGPFNAVINLERRELTLVLANGSYAGRFPIGVGTEMPPREGTYTVSDKVENPIYRGREKVVGAGEPGNPYGTRWIGLGADMGIHGTDRPENVGRTDLPGSISLGPRDIEDVFDILAAGSKVTIRR